MHHSVISNSYERGEYMRWLANVIERNARKKDVRRRWTWRLLIEVEGGGDNSDIEIDRPIFLRRTSRVGRGVVREQKEQKENRQHKRSA